MKTFFTILACVFIASPAHAGFFERFHNNIDEGVRELCLRKPDLCKKLEARQKRKAEAAPQNSVQVEQSISVFATSTQLVSHRLRHEPFSSRRCSFTGCNAARFGRSAA